MEAIRRPLHNSWVDYCQEIPDDIKVSHETFERLWNLHPEELGKVKVYNTEHAPRWFQNYGRSYTFSKVVHKEEPITDPYLVHLLHWVQTHSGRPYNGLLVNWYQDGSHSIGWHSDKENELVPGSCIYSFSFGQERDFHIRKRDTQGDVIKLKLCNNSLLIMGENMQSHYQHSVPKRALSSCPGRRINVTMRLFK